MRLLTIAKPTANNSNWQDIVQNMAINAGIIAIMGAIKDKRRLLSIQGTLLQLADAIYMALGKMPLSGKKKAA